MTSASRTYRRIFWVLAVLGFTADIASKWAVWSHLEPAEHDQIMLIPNVFSIIHQNGLNRGALFGLGNEHGGLANGVFAVISALAAIVIIAWTLNRKTAEDGLLCSALGLVLAGASGNLYDRLVFGGVRDFFWFRIVDETDGSLIFNWPVFNVADVCLVCGAGLLLLHAFISGRQAGKEESGIRNPESGNPNP